MEGGETIDRLTVKCVQIRSRKIKFQKGGLLIELYQIVVVGRCIDLGCYRRSIFIIHPAAGNSLDTIHSLTRLYCNTNHL
jgi:hypothetical protein